MRSQSLQTGAKGKLNCRCSEEVVEGGDQKLIQDRKWRGWRMPLVVYILCNIPGCSVTGVLYEVEKQPLEIGA